MASLDLAALLPQSLRDRIAPLVGDKWRAAPLAGAALAALFALGVAVWLWIPSYAVLYAGLSAEEGGRAIAALQKSSIPYRISEGGRVILVPAEDVGRARLELALSGVPKQDSDDWALLDTEGLGVSPFVERVHYLRAVEGALAHTIRQINGVAAATVKLALPKQTDFLADTPKPSASVMVRLIPGVELSAPQVEGIAGLVAASVPGLTRENVTIVDQSGRVLTRNDQDALQQVPEQLGIARDIERRYRTSVTELLAPVLGRGNFRVSIDADLDFSSGREASVSYGKSHVLSQNESVHPEPSGDAPIGIPGALSNRPPANPTVVSSAPNNNAPPPAATSAPAPASGPASAPNPAPKTAPTPVPPPATHKVTSYDLDRTVAYLQRPSWTLRAINAAILVNDPSGRPLPAARIQSIKTLVGTAIGIGQNRHVAVVALPFVEAETGALPSGPHWWQDKWAATVARNTLLALGGLLLLFGGLLPLLRRVEAAHMAIAQTAAAGRVGANERAAAPGGSARVRPKLVPVSAQESSAHIDADALRALVANDPGRTAQVIKEWIARDRHRLKAAG
jgi:flagellar M-ring protein FliF